MEEGGCGLLRKYPGFKWIRCFAFCHDDILKKYQSLVMRMETGIRSASFGVEKWIHMFLWERPTIVSFRGPFDWV